MVSSAHDSVFSRAKSEDGDAGPLAFAILLLVDVDVGIVESGVMDAFVFVLEAMLSSHKSPTRFIGSRVSSFFSLSCLPYVG